MSNVTEKKDRITIVTGFKGGNYGTKLQATALCKYFEKLGYNTSILDRFSYLGYFLRHPDIGLARIFNKCISKYKTRKFFDDKEHYLYSEKREKKLNIYDKENYNPVSIENKTQFSCMIEAGTTFVVGSDIIWQPAMGIPGYWFLDFIYYTELNRFSYATSIGANNLPSKYHLFYKKYLKKFRLVGVREKTGVELLKPFTNTEVVQVIDPTLLHDSDFWNLFAERALITDEIIEPGHFVFCYFVMKDSRYWEYVKLVYEYLINNPETKSYKIVVLPMHEIDENQPYTIIMEGTPNEFVYLVKNAAFIVTDSFHACAFSLNYEKEFYLLRRSRKDEDSKYDDFLSRYGLEERIVTDEGTFHRNTIIDYKSAHMRLSKDRNFAINFISKAMSK